MTTLTATAVITAVDRASAVFARVGANARAVGGRFSAAAAGVSRFGQAAAMNLGIPATLIGAISGRTEYEIDKLSRLMQSAGELSDQQRKMLTDTAFSVSTRTGQSAADIIKGQRELILGGLDAETAALSSEIIAKVSRANDIAAEKVAEDAITNASALGLAMSTTAEKVASLRTTLDFMSTVPAFSPMNWQDLSTSMKYVGPVAGALKIQMKDLGAALSMLAFAGFKGEEAGTALRTILTRLIAPTRKARIELRAAGVDPSELFNIDQGKINDKEPLLDALQQQGLMTVKERAGVAKRLARVDARKFAGNASEYTDALNAVLVKALGLGRGDSQDRDILKAAIDNHIFRAVGDLDMEKVFMALKDVPLKTLKEMFGLQRLSQAKALVNKINEIVTLPNGERISAWKKLADEIGLAIDGAADRKAEATLKGFWATIDKVRAAFENMNHQIFASGFGDQIAGVFEKLAGGISSLSQTDPEKLQKIGWALTALMTAPLVGMGPAGLAALALAFTDLSDVFRGGLKAELGPDGTMLWSRESSPISSLIKELNLLFSIDPSESPLGAWFGNLSESVKTVAENIRAFRESLKGTDKTGDAAFDAGGDVGNWLYKRVWGEAYGKEYNEVPRHGLPALQLLEPFRGSAGFQKQDEAFTRRLAGEGNQPTIRDTFPDAGMQRVDVQGRAQVGVTGTVQGETTVHLEVEYKGPLGGPQNVVGSARISGDLNPGESSMDLEGAAR